MVILRLQALEDGKLELSIAFLVNQEMIAHWPQIVTYISNTSQRQEFQHVEGRVGIVCVELHVSSQMLMGLRCRVKHLIVKSLEIPISKLVWNCSKSSFKTIVKPSSGQLCPVVTKVFVVWPDVRFFASPASKDCVAEFSAS